MIFRLEVLKSQIRNSPTLECKDCLNSSNDFHRLLSPHLIDIFWTIPTMKTFMNILQFSIPIPVLELKSIPSPHPSPNTYPSKSKSNPPQSSTTNAKTFS